MSKHRKSSNKNGSKKNKHKSTKSKRKSEENSNIDNFNEDDFYTEENNYYSENQIQSEKYDEEKINEEEENLSNKTRERLKNKIIHWLDYDDKIKDLNARTKKYKDAKKQQEENILKMLNKLQIGEKKIDIHDGDENLRGRVYKHRSVTKGAIKEDIIRDALMEVIRNEKAVSQLVKKIEDRRPINERYYLKRTKGNKD
ncbi:hypothetical protein ma323 [Moumouvirus australiensis]|uniref:Uncharacterized protein n=1 Tax=Moumouvirus australiensis TaxID=2109587 RepID=A0A2P1ELF1_9VIRU|nr:hypothetical protein QKC55_gp582 [Moumouvirus australiensis]AVL94709.1 hypothetical protein ma323 [Moumouvirus australiensis]